MEEGKYFWWVCISKTPSAFAIGAANNRPAGGYFSGPIPALARCAAVLYGKSE
jgi:hypothetical protein